MLTLIFSKYSMTFTSRQGIITFLISALQSEAREYAVWSLSEIKVDDSRVTEAIIHAITDRYRMVREMAMKALGSSGDPRAFELLIAASADAKDESDRENAITALASSGFSTCQTTAGIARHCQYKRISARLENST